MFTLIKSAERAVAERLANYTKRQEVQEGGYTEEYEYGKPKKKRVRLGK